MRKKIIFVDDEVKILRGLRRMLYPKEAEWQMYFVENSYDALHLLEQEPDIHVLVTDILLPGMNGQALLDHVCQHYPGVVRIVLSGQSDRDALLRSVTAAHQFLSKPCSAERLIGTIEQATHLQNMLQNEQLRHLVSRVDALPSLPDHFNKLQEELRSPGVSMDRVGRIIGADMAMTLKVLQLANSAYFGLRTRVTNPVHAASLLGLDTIKSLVLFLHVFRLFERTPSGLAFVDVLWRHSTSVGFLAQAMAKAEQRDPAFCSDALTAGLLHDVGKLLLAALYPDRWRAVMAMAREERLACWAAEQQVFGATHAEVGAYLIGLWGLNHPTMEALAYHHHPERCLSQAFSVLTTVHVANALDAPGRQIDPALPPRTVNWYYLETIGVMHRYPVWEQNIRALLAIPDHERENSYS